MFAKVGNTLKLEKVNTLFDRIKHELISQKLPNRCLALNIATAFKDKLSPENLQYLLQSIKEMLRTPTASDLCAAHCAILTNLVKIMPLFGKHNWVDAELFNLVFQQYDKVTTMPFEIGINRRDTLREIFKHLFFVINQYSQDVSTVLLPKYLQLLNSEASNPYHRIMALESLLQLVLDHKVEHIDVSAYSSPFSKIAQQIFPTAEYLSQLVTVKEVTKEEGPKLDK